MTATPSAVVQAFFAAMEAGDALEARSKWDERAIWHLTGSHELARDYTRHEYFETLRTWNAAYSSYQADIKEIREYGDEIAILYMESSEGYAPGRASGVMVYRVVGGTIREGWAIPAFESGRYPF